MSLRYEQYRSFARTWKYLNDIADPKKTPGIPKIIRVGVQVCLTNFPKLHESGQPIWCKNPDILYDQYKTIRRARNFLRSLLDPKETPKLPRKYRTEAYRCLRHFPTLHDSGQPIWSQDPFTEDEPNNTESIASKLVKIKKTKPRKASNRERRSALAMYIGERCKGCGKTFEDVESLRGAVWWPWEEGRVAHKDCFIKHFKVK